MDIHTSLQTRRDDILSIAARHGARNVRVFGSVAAVMHVPIAM